MTKSTNDNKAIYWTDSSISGLNFLSTQYSNHEFAPHTHESFAIGVVDSGALSFKYKSPSDIVPAGNIMIIHPGEVHTGKCIAESGCSYQMIYVEPNVVLKAFPDFYSKFNQDLHFKKQNIADNYIANSIRQAFRSFSINSSPLIEKESKLQNLLEKLISRYSMPGCFGKIFKAEKIYVKKAKQFLEDNYGSDLSLKDLAKEVNISPYHLLRMFKGDLGISPHAYLTQIRIQKSKRYLIQGSSISEVAQLTGFCDQAQFTKRFKQLVGTTPGLFQKKQQ